jgi:ribonuclease E
MVLYEADLDKLAVEVKSVSKKNTKSKAPKEEAEPKKKAPRKRKAAAIEPVESTEPKAEPVEPKAEPIITPTVEVKVEPESKPEPEPEPTKPVEEPPKKKRAPRKKADPTVAPAWFEKYVEGVKKEQATMKSEKVPAKKVKEEAKEAASKSWNHGLTRNRVQNEVDGHSKILLT